MKVVIDCNVFIMAISSKSPYHSIITSLKNGVYQMHMSTEIFFEFKEKIEEKFRKDVGEAFLDALYVSPFVIVSEPVFKWNLITTDPDDNKFVDCAIAAGVDYIVTNDKHYNILKQIDFPKVNCITIEEFIKILKAIK